MVDLSDSSDAESINSDEELQRAFSKGELKPGLNLGLYEPVQIKNDVDGMGKKLEELKQSIDWIERLDMTNAPAPAPHGVQEFEASPDEGLEHNDFKRELKFYRQGQATVLLCLENLHKMGVKTRRPDDYFAEMAKSDGHMKKVREKLLEKQKGLENREKARKLRDLKKYGKKVQQEVILKRHKEKREMLDAVKKFRKGQKDQLDFLDDKGDKGGGDGKKKQEENNSMAPNKRRQFKNKKFGYGGQKKRSKSNTKESSNDPDMFKQRGLKQKSAFNKKKPGNKGGNKGKRLGKSKRVAMKNRKKK